MEGEIICLYFEGGSISNTSRSPKLDVLVFCSKCRAQVNVQKVMAKKKVIDEFATPIFGRLGFSKRPIEDQRKPLS